MNHDEINKAFDEEYIKYRDAFPKEYKAMRNAVEAMDKRDYEMADHILCQARKIRVDCYSGMRGDHESGSTI